MPDFIAVDEINSQVITSESNIKNYADLQTMSTTSRIGVSESNIKTTVSQQSSNLNNYLRPINPFFSGEKVVIFNRSESQNCGNTSNRYWRNYSIIFCKIMAPKTGFYKLKFDSSSTNVGTYTLTSWTSQIKDNVSAPIVDEQEIRKRFIAYRQVPYGQSVNQSDPQGYHYGFSTIDSFVYRNKESDDWKSGLYSISLNFPTANTFIPVEKTVLLIKNNVYFFGVNSAEWGITTVKNIELSYYQ